MAEVLYRKWRPRALDQVVGQDTVTNTLRNAVSSGRLTHAYLFCGPRGTGKTSTARILAKAVNCLHPTDGEPDNSCDRCLAVNEGRALDLIEIDAASNRSIDDIRDLSDKINFAPAEFRYKVYIVDEVHMLTDPAFNALLKTLEEPPDHAIFILATTEVHRVPLTIVSRCQRYDFRRISLDDITEKLAELCEAEGVEAEREALELIARHSTGSLRDAENLLEQAVLSYDSPLRSDQVRDMLELSGDEDALDLCQSIVEKDVSESLNIVNKVSTQGSDLRQLQRAVTDFLRSVLLIAVGADGTAGLSDDTTGRLKSMSQGVDQRYLFRALKAISEADLRLDTASPLPLELALVESSIEPVSAAAPSPAAPPAHTRRRAAPPQRTQRQAQPAANRAPARSRPSRAANIKSSPARNQAPANGGASPTPPRSGQDGSLDPATWNEVLRALRTTGARFKLGALLRGSREYTIEDDKLIVRFAHGSHVERINQEIDNPSVKRELNQALSRTMGGEYELVPELISNENGSETRRANQSHLVMAAQRMGAKLVDRYEEETEQ